MKLKSIKKIKGYKSFQDFTWQPFLNNETFHDEVNILYGENGSGKSSIANLLKNVSENKDFGKYKPVEACLVFDDGEKKCTYDKDKFKQYPENGEFEIKTDDGTTVKNTDVATNVLPIKIFNQDFIDDNISFEPSTSCTPYKIFLSLR